MATSARTPAVHGPAVSDVGVEMPPGVELFHPEDARRLLRGSSGRPDEQGDLGARRELVPSDIGFPSSVGEAQLAHQGLAEVLGGLHPAGKDGKGGGGLGQGAYLGDAGLDGLGRLLGGMLGLAGRTAGDQRKGQASGSRPGGKPEGSG